MTILSSHKTVEAQLTLIFETLDEIAGRIEVGPDYKVWVLSHVAEYAAKQSKQVLAHTNGWQELS